MLDEILMNITIIQEIWQHHRESLMMSRILRKEGIENSGSEESLQSLRLPCFFSSSEEKKSRRQKSLMFITDISLCILTCTQSMTIPSYLSSEMQLQKFPDQTKFQSWIAHFRAEVCAKSEESRARNALDQVIEASSSLKDLINSKPITGKDFSDYEELDWMMAAELKRCYDIVFVFLVYEMTRQKGEKLLHRAEDRRMFSAEDNWVFFEQSL